ncbi:MAG: sialidase family protein [Janthinobacterium lividum]
MSRLRMGRFAAAAVRLTLRFFYLLLILCCAAPFCSAQSAGELIYSVGATSFPSAHASTVVELRDGTVMSAWFGGTAEGKPDVAIWSARRDGKGWSAPVEMVRESGTPCFNPVLFHAADGKLWMYYKFGPTAATWSAGRISSTDEGTTWSKPEHMPAGLLGPIRAKPLVLKDGTIVSGSSFESYREWAVWIERSTDNGATWAKIGPIVPPVDLDQHGLGDGKPMPPDPGGSMDSKFTQGIIQPSVVQMSGSHLRLYARPTLKTARVVVADSMDNGKTWTQGRPIDVPNPNSGIDALALPDGRIVLIYNNTVTGRTPLNLAVSTDGEHFHMFKTLEDAPGEYSYPALVQAANGDLLMTYTWNRKTIKYVRLPVANVPR